MNSWADDLSLLCIFRRSEPGASVTCFPFGVLSMWFLLVFRKRRKIRFRKKLYQELLYFLRILLIIPPGLLFRLSAVYDFGSKSTWCFRMHLKKGRVSLNTKEICLLSPCRIDFTTLALGSEGGAWKCRSHVAVK